MVESASAQSSPQASTSDPKSGSTLRDLGASFLVFLVAVPLSVGIAVASGVDPERGIFAAIIGGLVVGALGGRSLLISGPAAGLVSVVVMVVEEHQLSGLLVATAIAGLIQLVAGMAKVAHWFRAVAPSVLQGMLAGIGLTIALSQVHVMVDDEPSHSAYENLISLPGAFMRAVAPEASAFTHHAAAVGLLTMAIVILWKRLRPDKLEFLPGQLVAIVAATAIAAWLFPDIQRLAIPHTIAEEVTFPDESWWALIQTQSIWIAGGAIALVASAEMLLCAEGVDPIHDGPRTNYDRQLFALGVGNILGGVVGALPVTAVVVRSKANVRAGARSRLSTLLHGVWLVLAIALVPQVINLVPRAALGAMLASIGYTLVNWRVAKTHFDERRGDFYLFVVTALSVAFLGLLWGVAIGTGLSVVRILRVFTHLEITVEEREGGTDVYLAGAATFLRLPDLAQELEALTGKGEVELHLGGCAYVDHAITELLRVWQTSHENAGGTAVFKWDALQDRRGGKPVVRVMKQEDSVAREPIEDEASAGGEAETPAE